MKLQNGTQGSAIRVVNQTATTRAFELQFSFPVLGSLKDLEADGILTMKLIASADGGVIQCGPQGAAGGVMNFMFADSGAVAPISWCPFIMGTTGAGTAVTTFFLGQAPIVTPGSGVPLPGSVYSHLGVAVGGLVTAFDEMILTPGLVLFGSAMCQGDLNLDFKVSGQDLGIMLSDWGTNSLVADLNANGTVEGADLEILLSNFGDCAGTPAAPMTGPVTGGEDASNGAEMPSVVEIAAGTVDVAVAPEVAAPSKETAVVVKSCENKTIKKAAKEAKKTVANGKIAAKKKAQALKKFKRCVESQVVL